jgi:hypothetical protein
MNRYITRRYVAIYWADAVRLAKLDSTVLSKIRCYQNVELLHRTDWWAWWSDEFLTTAIGLPENLRTERLSADAAKLISDVWEGGLIMPQCGWTTLANVTSISGSEVVYTANINSNFSSSRWEKLTLFFEHNRQGFLYRHRYCDELGYKCDIANECL